MAPQQDRFWSSPGTPLHCVFRKSERSRKGEKKSAIVYPVSNNHFIFGIYIFQISLYA